MPHDLVASRSAYALKVEREASMAQHAVFADLDPSLLKVRVELGIVGVAEQDCFAWHSNPRSL